MTPVSERFLRITAYLAVISIAILLELSMQNVEINRCRDRSSERQGCVEQLRAWDDVAKNGVGAAVIFLPILGTHKRFQRKIESLTAGASFPLQDPRFRGKLRLVQVTGILSTVIVFGGLPFWISVKYTVSSGMRIAIGLLVSAALLAMIISAGTIIAWVRRYRSPSQSNS